MGGYTPAQAAAITGLPRAAGLRLLPVGTRREIAESIQQSPKTERLPVANGEALLIEVGIASRAVES